MTVRSKSGIFCTSFDIELAWGLIDQFDAYPRFESILRKGRECFFRVVALHEELSVPTTWALVGHLLHDSCKEGRPHGHMPKPTSGWDRFSLCPCKDGAHHPLWHARDFVERLRRKADLHDIACHTYSHLQYGHPKVTAAMVEADLTAFVDDAETYALAADASRVLAETAVTDSAANAALTAADVVLTNADVVSTIGSIPSSNVSVNVIVPSSASPIVILYSLSSSFKKPIAIR